MTGGLILGAMAALLWLALESAHAARAATIIVLVGVSIAALVQPRVFQWLPQRRKQVSGSRIQGSDPSGTAFKWGVELGLGISTLVVTPAFYAFLGVLIAQASALAVVAVTVIYGTSRGGAIALMGLLNAHQEATVGGGLAMKVGRLRQVLRGPLLLVVTVAGGLSITAVLGGGPH